MLKNMRIGMKQACGFLLVAAIVAVAGGVGINGLSKIGGRLTEITQTTPLVDAAMEMKISVARDMQMIMELLASQTGEELDQVWQEHESFVKDFDTYAEAILHGAQTDEGMIYAATDDGLKKIVNEANRFHNEEFQPRIKKIYNIMAEKADGRSIDQNALSDLDKEADAIGEKMLDILGGIEDGAKDALKSAEERAEKESGRAKITMIIITLAGVLVAISLGFFITRAITGPIKLAVEFTDKLAKGDFSASLALDQADEVGDLVRSLNQMKESLSSMIQDINKGISTLESSASDMSGVAAQMTSSSEETVAKANTMAAAAEEMTSNMDSIAAAMEESTSNVNAVAAATEEMSSNIGDISRRATEANENTREAVDKAGASVEMISELGQATEEIGMVTETIAAISDKTNLLALNATIEAARAGEAGKGFAVVANEIKDLAQQTAEATTDIAGKLKGIQTSTSGSVAGINEIADVIRKVDETVAAISESMEQQNSATSEISGNVSQTSQGLKEINENAAQTSQAAAQVATEVSAVNDSASEINNSSAMVQQNASALSDLAGKLKEMVGKFKV